MPAIIGDVPRPPQQKNLAPLTVAACVALASGTCRHAIALDPLPPRLKGDAETLFERLGPDITGLGAALPDNPSAARLPQPSGGAAPAGRIAVGDIDGDDQADLFICGGEGASRLYRQVRPWQFEDITAAGTGLDGAGARCTGAVFADFDRDGDADLLVTCFDAPCRLFLNLGPQPDGRPVAFTEAAAACGIALRDATLFPAVADADRDGDLDVFLVTGTYPVPPEAAADPVVRDAAGERLRAEAAPWMDIIRTADGRTLAIPAGRPDYFFRNESNGPGGRLWFSETTADSGIAGRGDGITALWTDLNADGWPDLCVANSGRTPDAIWLNAGDGTFFNGAHLTSVVPHFTAALAAADATGDGLPDLFAGGLSATAPAGLASLDALRRDPATAPEAALPRQAARNVLLASATQEFLTDIAFQSGLAELGAVRAAAWLDADGDGRLDLAVLTTDFPDGGPSGTLRLFRQDESGAFPDMTDAWGCGGVSCRGRDLVAEDLDGDGDEDLVMTAAGMPPILWRNAGTAGSVVRVCLDAEGGRRIAAGAVVTAAAGPRPVTRTVGPGVRAVSLPLGGPGTADSLSVRWADGAVTAIPSVIAGNRVAVACPAQPDKFRPPLPRPWFAMRSDFAMVRHRTPRLDEFTAQPLLPGALGRVGPALAWTDVDADGDSDLLIATGSGTPPSLRRGNGQGTWTAETPPALTKTPAVDAAALWLDADRDGDPDLLTGGGLPAAPAGATPQSDRLFLNDGKGTLVAAAPGAWPQDGQATGVICAADFDRDGDADVFSGTRCAARQWPDAAPSRLLRNDGGAGGVSFSDVTSSAAPALADAGLVTAAVWSDLNNDGWLDLAVAAEWGTVRIFLNHAGRRLEGRPGTADDLARLSGRWHSITAFDADGDGDMDLAAGNLGTNTSSGDPSTSVPALAWEGIFEQSGTRGLILARHCGDRLVFERPPDALMPILTDTTARHPDPAAWRRLDPEALLGEALLPALRRRELNTTRSGVFLNETPPQTRRDDVPVPVFRFMPFPAPAQAAPVFGIGAADFDADGLTDLVLAQNDRGRPPGSEPADAGTGVVLFNQGSGRFAAAAPLLSGLSLRGEGRACTIADLNADGRPDFLLSVFGEGLIAMVNACPRRGPSLRVLLPPGRAAGARVTVERSGVRPLVAEHAAGGGWLSQNEPALWFGLGSGPANGVVTVRWADGTVWMQSFDENRLTLTAPPR